MADVIYENVGLTLTQITRREVDRYAGNSDTARLFPVLDDENQIYAVVVVENDPTARPAYAEILARVVGEYVVIEEDYNLDKPLVDALMVNAQVPREKIILAYKGEKLPE
jgi:hypothetical protein